MKIYLAGSSFEMPLVNDYMRQLRAGGVEITRDWPKIIREYGNRANRGLTEEDRVRVSLANLKAIDEADMFWLIVPTAPSAGCWIEFGYAIRVNKLTIASGDVQQTVFTSHAFACFASHDDALQRVFEYHRDQQRLEAQRSAAT
jgi:hypothetical protein